MKALVVEDEPTNRVMLQSFLSIYGECQVVTNGKDAIAAFRRALEANERFDLICMDIVMPKMNGHEAVLAIRTLEHDYGVDPRKRARIVMTSVLNNSEAVYTAVMLDCDAYLLKPINLRKLLAHLKAFGLAPS
jgi:two-component system chemotaxis response regulator CheY